MKLMACVISALIVVFCPVAAVAETPTACKSRLGDEVKCFVTEASATQLLCSLSVKLALLDPSKEERAGLCLKAARISMRDHYDATLKRIPSKGPALDALKDSYVTWQSTIDGLRPSPGETSGQYDVRIASEKKRLDEKLYRLELEAPRRAQAK